MHDWLEPAIRAHGPDGADGMRHIASRTSSGGLMAAIMASGDGAAGVMVEDAQWTDTLYLMAFCLVELGRLAEAAPYLQRALALLPGDVVYACELGNILQAAHDYTGALALFQAALENVNMLSATSEFGPTPTEPEGGSLFGMTMEEWTRRSMRGIGFQLIELGQLDQAEAIYREILAIDPNDAAAMNELAYIDELRRTRGY
jgi:tetratricopeptide (TPR) repeat protein